MVLFLCRHSPLVTSAMLLPTSHTNTAFVAVKTTFTQVAGLYTKSSLLSRDTNCTIQAAQPSTVPTGKSLMYLQAQKQLQSQTQCSSDAESLPQMCQGGFGLHFQQTGIDKDEGAQYLAREQGLLNQAVASEEHHVTGSLARQQHHHISWNQAVRINSPAFITTSALIVCRCRCKARLSGRGGGVPPLRGTDL